MAEQIPGNLTSTTVAAGGYSSGAATLNVASTALPFPAAGNFSIVVYDASIDPPEPRGVLRVSAVNSATQWAVTAEDSNFSAVEGDPVYAVISQDALTALLAQLNYQTVEDEGTPVTQRGTLNFVGAGVAVTDSGGKTRVTISGGGGGGGSISSGSFASLPGSAPSGDLYIGTPGPYQFLGDGADWNPLLPTVGAVVLPPSVGWAWGTTQGTALVDQTDGSLTVYIPGTSGDIVRSYEQTPGSANFTVEALIQCAMPWESYVYSGITLRESATGKILLFGYNFDGLVRLRGVGFSNSTTWAAYYGDNQFIPVPYVWLKVVVDASNVTCSYKVPGYATYTQVFQTAKTTPFTTTPNRAGLGGSKDAGVAGDVILFVRALSFEIT